MDIFYINNLLNKRIIDVGRCSDMCWIVFGSENDNNMFSLHLQCPWRICRSDKILVSNMDIYNPIDCLKDADFAWDDTQKMVFDKKMESFKIEKVYVSKIEVSKTYDLAIYLSEEYKIECFVNDLDNECWRLLKKGSKQHLVVMGRGIEL